MTESDKPRKYSKSAGRPARLSKEQILEAALALLRESEGKDLSIRQLAQRLATVPGNLYTYFPSKEVLLDALSEYALQSLEPDVADASLPWDLQISRWMTAFRQSLLQRPELMFVMGVAGTSPSTLAKIGRIARLMQDQGMDAATAVLNAQGLIWTVMNHTHFEMNATTGEVLAQLHQQARDDEHGTLQFLAVDNLEPLWQATLERNLDGVRLQVSRQK